MASKTTHRQMVYFWVLPVAMNLSGCGGQPADYVSAGSKAPGLRAVDAVATEDNVAKQKNNSESKPTPPDLGLPDTLSLIDAKFKVEASTAGQPSCKGTMNVQVNAALNSKSTAQLLQVPAGGLDCSWLGKIDLKQMFGAFSQPPSAGEDPMVIANNVLALKTLGAGTYSPPRPLLPSFLAATREQLSQLNYTERNITVQVGNKTAKGNVNIKMNYYDRPLTAPGTTYQFKHVMDFTITSTGFDSIDKNSNFIYDSIQFTMSTSPVSIIGIKLKGNAKSQFIAQKSNLKAVSGLLKIITIIANLDPTGLILAITGLIPMELNLSLEKQDDLENQLAQVDQTSPENIGETIGGQPTK
ncbi:MAG: hypothetical protein FJ146_16555 [Deltaproteobacteria bacterium]|nr:hypothetical protein [Deltaproteobacteria bacterium]